MAEEDTKFLVLDFQLYESKNCACVKILIVPPRGRLFKKICPISFK